MIVAIDTETGGTNPEKSALLSISAVLLDQPNNSFTVFINPEPGKEMNPDALKINGYSEKLWKERGAVSLIEALQKFKKWLPYSGNDPLAHNAHFDKAFIESGEKQTGYKLYLRYRWRCSMQLFMGADDALGLNAPDYKLETLARMSGYWSKDYVRGDHQSLDDVKACAEGYKWLIGQIRIGKKIKEKENATTETI